MGKTELGLICLNNKRHSEASLYASFIRRLSLFLFLQIVSVVREGKESYLPQSQPQ